MYGLLLYVRLVLLVLHLVKLTLEVQRYLPPLELSRNELWDYLLGEVARVDESERASVRPYPRKLVNLVERVAILPVLIVLVLVQEINLVASIERERRLRDDPAVDIPHVLLLFISKFRT